MKARQVIAGVVAVLWVGWMSPWVAGQAPPASQAPLRVLIFSGLNNHDWKTTTPFIQKVLNESGRFAADVTEDPASCTAESLAKYDAIVDNWSAHPQMTGRQWGATAEKAILDFVRAGKGFVVVHAATACFSDWPEFDTLVGCAWRENANHTAYHAFTVNVVDKEHPITKGMPDFVTGPDELYQRLRPQPSMHVVCSAYANPQQRGTGQVEPMAVTTEYGQGRCFNLILGHDVPGMDNPAWRTLMLRGTEWAATGNVTIPIPDNWPTAKPPIKIALLTGGHDFEHEPFFAMFKGYPDIVVARQSEEADSATVEDISGWDCDVIVHYGMNQRISEKARQNFLSLLDKGVGVVFLHHAIALWPDWPQFRDILGARYYLADVEENGVKHAHSVYEHGVDMRLHIADTEHPITRGLADFVIKDETYGNFDVAPDNHVLITCDTPGSANEVLWVRRYRNANICFVQGGHDATAYNDANFRHLLSQSIRWAAGRLEASVPARLHDALRQVIGYQEGESRAGLYRVGDLVALSLANEADRASAERELMATLGGDATGACKQFICKQLSVIGSDAAVPLLAGYLGDAQLDEAARYALERLATPAADAALLNALSRVTDIDKIGLINTLGERRNAESVEALAPLLNDSDVAVACASACALGKIGGAKAVEALKAVYATAKGEVRDAVFEAYLACAEQLLEQGDAVAAGAMFQGLMDTPEASAPIRAGALRGAALAGGDAAVARVCEALKGEDRAMSTMAVRLVREWPNAAATLQIADALPGLPGERQAQVLDALAQRGDKAALPAVFKATQSGDVAVRCAAWRALGELGDSGAVPALVKATASADPEEQGAARTALATMRGDDVDGVVAEGARSGAMPERLEYIRAIAARRMRASSTLIVLAGDPDASVRAEAFKALAVIAQGGDQPLLTQALLKASEADRPLCEEAIVAMARNLPEDADKVSTLVAAWPGVSDAAAKCSLLRVLGQIGDPRALDVVRGAVNDPAPAVREVAVAALANWPTPDAIADALRLAKEAESEAQRLLALQGAIRMLGLPTDRPAAEIVALYTQALDLATRIEEKRQALGGLAAVEAPSALELIAKYLDSEETRADAIQATCALANALVAKQPEAAQAALDKVLPLVMDPAIEGQVRSILAKARMAKLEASNIAREAIATSPDDLEKDGGATGDAGLNDGDPNTYWDEVDDKPLYKVRLEFKEAKAFSTISVMGYAQQDYAPKDFDILCDDKVVKSVKGAVYTDNLVFIDFPPQTCKALELAITGYYGHSPAIREIGVFAVAP